MRRSIFIWLSCLYLLPLGTSAQEINRSKFSNALLQAIDSKSDHTFNVYVMLEEQLELEVLIDSLKLYQVPVKERAIIINKKLRAIAAGTQPEVIKSLENLGIQDIAPLWIVNTLHFTANREQLISISQLDKIEFIDLELEVRIDDPIPSDDDGRAKSIQGNREPGLELIKAPEMWARGYTGYGTKAYILDTGIDPMHPTLARNYAGNVLPEEQSWFGLLNYFNRPFDCADHGTHVTGTILGLDVANQDTIGVAYNAMWMGAPILRACGPGRQSILSSFQWALDPDDNPNTTDDMPDVINNSWYTTAVDYCHEPYEFVFTALEAAGVAIVFSAGNFGPDPMSITIPKNINLSLVNTFAVGALDARNLDIAGFSSRGPSHCPADENSLIIKPEVSAPGVGVRSAVPGNGFRNFNGTSMAAPHASGAILLLKEAFPYLSGEEIKLALYFTAIDLGEPGEDNVYGMGLIDTDAAFHYLLDQGYVPVNPNVGFDLAIESFSYSVDVCNGRLSVALQLRNQGTEMINKLSVKIYDDQQPDQVWLFTTINNALSSNDRSNLEFQIPLQEEGRKNFRIEVDIVDQIDNRSLNNFARIVFDYFKVNDWQLKIDNDILTHPQCSGTNIIIQNQDTTNELLWYDTESDQYPFFTGNLYAFVLPEYESNVGFSLGSRSEVSLFTKDHSNEIIQIETDSLTGVIMYTLHETHLNTVSINVPVRSLYTVMLKDDSENVIWSTTRTYNVGGNEISVNRTIPANTIIELVVRGSRGINAYHFEHPFQESNSYIQLLDWNIHDSTVQNLFVTPIYNINFWVTSPCNRKSLNIDLIEADELPIAYFNIFPNEPVVLTDQTLSLYNESEQSSHYIWDFGDGTRSEEAFPEHTYSSPGDYSIILTAINDNGCRDMTSRSLEVVEDATTATSSAMTETLLQVFPNPVSSELYVVLENTQLKIVSVEMMNINGAIITTSAHSISESQISLNLISGRPTAGIYLLRVVLSDGSVVTRRVAVI